jgi:hypothetical protein
MHALWVVLITGLWGIGSWGVLYGAYWTVQARRAEAAAKYLERQADIRHNLHDVQAYVMVDGEPRYYPVGMVPDVT